MKNIAHKFLTYRELSVPLTRGSREVISIATDIPENRTRLFKPMDIIKTLDDEDPDDFQKNILDRYTARASSLSNMCLAEFVSNYRLSYSRSCTKDNDNYKELTTSSSTTITFKYDLGQI